MHTFSSLAELLHRHPLEVRTLILARGIKYIKIGRAYAVDEDGLKALKKAFEELDKMEEKRGGRVAVASA